MNLRTIPIIGLTLLLASCETVMLGNVLVGCAIRPEPEFMPKELPTAQVGATYDVRIDVINASTPVGRILDDPEGALPKGLSIIHTEREKYGFIRGVPEQAGTYEVLLYASTFGTQCAGQYAEITYRLEVTE
ncbi:hypothetical protein N7333_10260 [Pseudomonas sp. GD04158]|uniref:hypothetical protein n=1 Tax=Pseudomonas sp. GD04158 TaxID=2975439 RepID=UPI000BC32783|nr:MULTISPECIES: hypothetical protein [unclassified Pseudomonas]ATH80446.1 hypothetical protein CO724_04405 [Pseudomonas mendocina]MDH0096962.1 hypothetical protein [Pseudomonas sp. GD04158]UTH35980.1 hypothetical protein NLY39_20335 [Pseudomonas sp. KHPS1]